MTQVYGLGSWSETKRRNTVYQVYRVYIDGKQKSFYGKTKADATRKYREYVEKRALEPDKSTLTVGQVAEKAVELRKESIKASTQMFYEYGLKALREDKISNLQIQSVNVDDLQGYINSLKDKISFNTIKRQKIILSMAFTYAEDMGIIEKNLMSKVRLPNEEHVTKDTRQPIFLTTDERKMLEVEAERKNTPKLHMGKMGEPIYGVNAKALVFILHTGLRIGELRALSWDNVDMSGRAIRITQNAPSAVKDVVTSPKRKSSIRRIPLDDVAYEIILELSDDKNGEYVFHTDSGKMLSRTNVGRTLDKMIERSGLTKRPTIHDLRHTYASELIRNGADVKTVSLVMGHSDIATTLNIYVHKSDEDFDILRTMLK